MNKLVFIVLILLLSSCADKKPLKKEEPKKQTDSVEQPAKIEFDSEMHDFGKVKAGEILSYSFIFTNRGQEDLTIKNAEADCGCLKVTIPKEPVKPDEKGIIEVELNSAGLIGKQLKTVEIQSNSKEPKHLIIFAEVENEQIEIKY